MGQFALVDRSILIPAGILGHSVAQAFTAELSNAIVSKRNPIAEFRRVVLIMAAIGAASAVVLFLFGQQLFLIAFGSQWAEAGRIAEVASVMLVTHLAVTPVNMTLLMLGLQKQQLAWEAARLGSVLTLWGLVMHFQVVPLVAIALHAGLMVVMALVFLYLAYRALRLSPPVQHQYSNPPQ